MKVLKFIFKTTAVLAVIGVVAFLLYLLISKKKPVSTAPATDQAKAS